MARVQSRRTISINRKLYDRAISDSIQLGIPLSQLCEEGLLLVLKMDDAAITAMVNRRRVVLPRKRS